MSESCREFLPRAQSRSGTFPDRRIDRAFDQAKPQHLGVEIEIPLWIRSDGRHMRYSGSGFHLRSIVFRPFDPLPDMRKPSTVWIRPEAVLIDFQRLDLRFQR